jgi:flavin-dependent dehydrogenase
MGERLPRAAPAVSADHDYDYDHDYDHDYDYDYDVAIVGGGPVGLAAAIEARMAGLSVVLVEQRTGPIDKACGEGLMPGARPLLARLGVSPDGFALRGVSYRQGARAVTHRFAGDGAMGVRRTTLHAAMSARADELGVTRAAARVGQVRTGLGGVTVSAEATGGAPWQVTARYLLGCDGLHSTVARLAGLSRTRASTRRPGAWRSRRYGVRQHYAIEPWSENIEVYYGPEAEIYVTPVSPTVVGLAMLARQGTDFDAALAAVPELAARVAGAPAASARRGAGPFLQRRRARTSGRILLVGDASGYVDAITGEGLRLGFSQARQAVRCIVADRPLDYERAWKRETRDFRLLTSGLVLLATSPLRGAIVPLAARFPRLFDVIVERLAR